MALSDLVIDIAGSAHGFQKTVGQVGGGLRGLQSTSGKVASAMKASFAGVATVLAPLAAIAGVWTIFKDGSELAKVQIAAEKKLAAVFKATGRSAAVAAEQVQSLSREQGALDFTGVEGTLRDVKAGTQGQTLDLGKAEIDASGVISTLKSVRQAADVTVEEIQKIASERQGVTNFGDEATLDAAAILGTFKSVKGDQFRKAIPLMQDMAALMDGDLSTAAMQFGKALNDPIAGLGVLSRVGVQFTHAQKEMIKGLVESGKLTEAQGVIMAEFEGQMGGTAEAMAHPLVQAGNAWADFKEQLGFIFDDLKIAALEAFGFDTAVTSAQNMSATFRSEWLPSIKAVLTGVAKYFRTIVDMMTSFWSGWIGSTIKEIFYVAENWDTFLLIAVEKAKLFATNSISHIQNFFSNFQELMRWLGANWPELMQDMGNFLLAATKNMAANIGEFFSSVMDFAKGKGFKPKFKSLTDGFESSLKELPKFTKANVQESTAELDRLMGEAAKARLEFGKRFGASGDAATPPGLLPPGGPNDPAPTGVTRDDFKPSQSIEAGTKEAFAKIFAAQSGKDKKQPEKETAKNTQLMAATLKDLQRLWEKMEKKLGIEKVVEFIG